MQNAHCAVKPDVQNSVISFVISKWMLPKLSFSDRWSRGTKLWERDWNTPGCADDKKHAQKRKKAILTRYHQHKHAIFARRRSGGGSTQVEPTPYTSSQ